jgi:hypothetical protein
VTGVQTCALPISYRANPEPEESVELEAQYQRLATATSHRLREARGYIEKAVRS